MGSKPSIRNTSGSAVAPAEAIILTKNTVKLSRVRKEIEKLVSRPECRDWLYGDPFPISPEDMSFNRRVSLSSLERELCWESCIASLFSNKITRFLKLKEMYETEFLKERYSEAALILDLIKTEFGWSIWWIENKMSLLEVSEGLEKQKEFSLSITKNNNIDALIRYMTFMFSVRAERNVSADRFDSMMLESIREISSDSGYADYILFKLNVFNDKLIGEYKQIISFERELPIVDRFLTLIGVIQLIYAQHPTAKSISVLKKTIPLLNRISCREIDVINLYVKGASSFQSSSCSVKMIRALDAYTSGDYFLSTQICAELSSDKPLSFEVSELYARSLLRFQEEGGTHKAPHIERWIEKDLIEILQRTERSHESFLKLIKFSYVNSSFSFSRQLIDFVVREYSSVPSEELHYHLLGCLNSDLYNPNHCFKLNGSNKKIFLSRLSREYPQSSVIKFFQAITNKHTNAAAELNLPTTRQVKYNALFNISSADNDSAIENYKFLINSNSSLDYQDGIRGLARCYLSTGQYNDCINLIADSYLKNENLSVFLPIKGVLSKINYESNNELLGNISTAIVYDIYSDDYGLDKEEDKSIVVQEVLDSFGAEKPSDLTKLKLSIDIDRLVYFLHKVCTVEVIDGMPVFSGPQAILMERMVICQRLISLDEKNSVKYQEEIKSLTQQMMIDRGIQEIDDSRIYVDEDGIKKIVDKELRESYSRYLEFLSKGIIPKDQYIEDLILKLKKEGTNLDVLAMNIPTDEVSDLFETMVNFIRDAFVSSNEYGLDGHLSVRIRHGTLSGELRSPLQAANLITARDQAGDYHENQYWKDSLSELSEEEINHLMNSLASFSMEVDGLIDLFKNEWVQIRNSKKEDGLFRFELENKELYLLRSSVTESTTHEEFSDTVVTSRAISVILCRPV